MVKTTPEAAARSWTERLGQSLGDRLRGVVLYGSVVRGEHIRGVSDINLALLFDEIDMALLEKTAALIRKSTAEGFAIVPFDWDDRDRAADSFGIELLDMLDAHETLAGDNPFRDLHVPPSALRLQAERELRARLVALDSRLLRSENAEQTGMLLMTALPAFVTYQRAALRLARQPVPATSPAVIEAACALVGAEPDGLLAAESARRDARRWNVELSDAVAGSFRDACRRTAMYVDAIETGESNP
ncbi:MAG: nucleotidyltransferase domain-containing protein [Gemmatimonadota bacterium]|jgi:predicted nucleotidyltransferase